MASGKTCLFCGSPGGSREHLFGAWLAERVDRSGAPQHFAYSGSALKPVEKTGTGLSVSKRIVGPCENCNNGWMSELEKIAGPLLLSLMEDQSQQLDRIQQRSLALWLTIKSMVWEWQEGVRKSVPSADREFIYANREPAAWKLPPDWYAWIGRTDQPFGVSGAYHVSHSAYRDEDGVWPDFSQNATGKQHAFTLFSGAFFGAVWRTPYASDGPFFTEATDLFLPVWPYRADMHWPPAVTNPAKEIWALPQNMVDASLGLLE